MIQHTKNTAFYLAFPMVSSTSPETFLTGLSPTDTAYYKDTTGAWTSLSITDTASEIGTTGIYEIDLTAAEANHDRIIVKFTATGAADTAYMIDTTMATLVGTRAASGGTVTVVSPISTTNELELTIGDDYETDYGTQLQFTYTSCPYYASVATCIPTLTIEDRNGTIADVTSVGTATVASTDMTFAFELTATQTATLAESTSDRFQYSIRVRMGTTPNFKYNTPIRGTVIVYPKLET